MALGCSAACGRLTIDATAIVRAAMPHLTGCCFDQPECALQGLFVADVDLENSGLLLVDNTRQCDKEEMNEAGKSRYSMVMWIVLAVVLLVSGLVSFPLFVRQGKCREGQTESVSNARQIGLALFEFQTAYGSFPDETTAAKVRLKTGDDINFGTASSNDYFRQLIAAQIANSEAMFYAKTAYTEKPDNVTKPGAKALAPGEVGFGYLMDGKSALDPKGNPSRPLACSPLALVGKTVSNQFFDSSFNKGRAVVLKMDNSVQSLSIDPDSRRGFISGLEKHLLQTGSDTVWGDSAKPVIVPPSPKN
jgi:hypothetical protein